jgi:hypothetical protein
MMIEVPRLEASIKVLMRLAVIDKVRCRVTSGVTAPSAVNVSDIDQSTITTHSTRATNDTCNHFPSVTVSSIRHTF